MRSSYPVVFYCLRQIVKTLEIFYKRTLRQPESTKIDPLLSTSMIQLFNADVGPLAKFLPYSAG